jgi:hypothetical protein
MRGILLWLMLLTAPIVQALGETGAETEIRSLIQAVRESGCKFDRNGTLYTAERAAEHLELKFARGERYAGSAEEFIERLATGSSWTGEPYWMICEGAKIRSADWLLERLEASRAKVESYRAQ